MEPTSQALKLKGFTSKLNGMSTSFSPKSKNWNKDLGLGLAIRLGFVSLSVPDLELSQLYYFDIIIPLESEVFLQTTKSKSKRNMG